MTTEDDRLADSAAPLDALARAFALEEDWPGAIKQYSRWLERFNEHSLRAKVQFDLAGVLGIEPGRYYVRRPDDAPVLEALLDGVERDRGGDVLVVEAQLRRRQRRHLGCLQQPDRAAPEPAPAAAPSLSPAPHG